jgi:hypothetical protein
MPDCARCGIIFARYLEREPPFPLDIPTASRGLRPDEDDRQPRVATLLVGGPASMAAAVGQAIFLVILCVWTSTLASRQVNAERVGSSFMHLPNLVFHEAGHFLFLPFGRFMNVLGGSLTQVLVPLVCAGAFLWQSRDAFGAAVATWWAAESLIDVAPYINDARDLQLVLLGGKTGAEVEGHDWEYLLNAMGLIHRDHAIAAGVQTIGTLAMIAALFWAAIVVMHQAGVVGSRRATPPAD